MSWLLLTGAIISEVVGTLLMRLSEGFRIKRWIPLVVIAYMMAFTLLALALARGMPVGIAYGIWAASGVALTAVAARLLFRDPLTLLMSLGILVIAGGVLLIELSAPVH